MNIHRSKQQGFTLLEAIVALVLIASTGMALLSWINTNLISLQRIQAVQERDTAIRNALAFLDTINPYNSPNGDVEMGVYQIQWQSITLETPIPGINKWSDPSIFDVGLYETRVKVLRNQQLQATFSVRLVGYKQNQEASELNTL